MAFRLEEPILRRPLRGLFFAGCGISSFFKIMFATITKTASAAIAAMLIATPVFPILFHRYTVYFYILKSNCKSSIPVSRSKNLDVIATGLNS